MEITVAPAARLRLTFSPPGDKSVTHRLMMLSALAEGECELYNISPGRDCLSTLHCLQALGTKAEISSGGSLHLRGGGLKEPQDVLDAGNSGTTLRLLCGLLAGENFFSVLSGDQSLRNRPMGRIVEPLQRMGASIRGRHDNRFPPLAIQGKPLTGIEYQMPIPSAQVKSALLLAGLKARGKTEILFELPSRDHTERILKHLGAALVIEKNRLELTPPFTPPPFSGFIPGDFSAAAFFIAAGILLPDSEVVVEKVGLNPTRTAFLELLKRMGARIEIEPQGESLGEPYGRIRAKSSRLTGVEVGPLEVPILIDELPLLALLGAKAEGRTVLSGAGELRFKESDRIKALATQLVPLGIPIEETPDGFKVEGPSEIKGGTAHSLGDHRIAMLLGLCGLLSREGVRLQEPEWAEISFPGFWELLGQGIKNC